MRDIQEKIDSFMVMAIAFGFTVAAAMTMNPWLCILFILLALGYATILINLTNRKEVRDARHNVTLDTRSRSNSLGFPQRTSQG